MQFTVLIEFLIPGLATVLLCLALLPREIVPQLLSGLPAGDASIALVLLAVSYPVGHLVNFPVFLLLQQRLLTPRARRRTVKAYSAAGVNLATLASRELGFRVCAETKDELQELFKYMEAMTFCRNIAQFNSHDLFYKSLQRLARGMLFPLLLAVFFVIHQRGVSVFSLGAAVILLASFVVCLLMLRHFLEVEDDEVARFFVTLTLTHPNVEGQPTTALNRTAPLSGAAG